MTSHDTQLSLKTRAKSRGISLTAAARTLGITREHLSRVLNGHRISARTLRRFDELTSNNQADQP